MAKRESKKQTETYDKWMSGFYAAIDSVVEIIGDIVPDRPGVKLAIMAMFGKENKNG